MADESSNYQNTQEQLLLEKKLRKREQRLLGRLQEAHAAHTNALERFQRAEARLLKRAARVQRLEARLVTLRQQIVALATVHAPSTGVDEILYADTLSEHMPSENTSNTLLLENNQDAERRSYVYETETDPRAWARIARAVAEATEEAARLAVERAHGVAMHLAHRATGSHLVQELLLLEADAARASVEALDAELAAQEAEKLASAEPLDLSLPLDTTPHDDTQQELSSPTNTIEVSADGEETPTLNEAMPEVAAMSNNETPNDEEQSVSTVEMPENNEEEVPVAMKMPNDGEEIQRSGEETGLHAGLPSATEQKRVAEIDEEEEMVEMVSAMMIADVAAANAAKAESLAEEASAHTREARRLAQEADTLLERIRTAVRNGTSTGDAAQAILFDAERDATHMHALLADAEAAEERARRFAMEAEADAEVAEGMAFAVEDRNEDAEKQREEEPTSHPLLNGQAHTGDTGEMERLDARQNVAGQKLEDEDTIETPIVQQQP